MISWGEWGHPVSSLNGVPAAVRTTVNAPINLWSEKVHLVGILPLFEGCYLKIQTADP